jgi:hypothetical protein
MWNGRRNEGWAEETKSAGERVLRRGRWRVHSPGGTLTTLQYHHFTQQWLQPRHTYFVLLTVIIDSMSHSHALLAPANFQEVSVQLDPPLVPDQPLLDKRLVEGDAVPVLLRINQHAVAVEQEGLGVVLRGLGPGPDGATFRGEGGCWKRRGMGR